MIIKSKLLTLLLVISTITVISLKASAQTPDGAKPAPGIDTKHQNVKQLSHNIRNERKERAIRRHDVRTGNEKGVVRTTKKIHRDNRAERRNYRQLKAQGVKHPVRRAEHRIRNH